VAGGPNTKAVKKPGRKCSFLKKRTKKLLPVAASIRGHFEQAARRTRKSFLLLFFKE
jgi:hypothetical protein